jgi:hypothetical protein
MPQVPQCLLHDQDARSSQPESMMKLQSILIAAVAVAFAAPGWAQSPPAAPQATKAEATFAALAPILAPRTAELSAAGVQKVVARTGKGKRDIQVLTRWGPSYLAWPKGVTPVTFEVYVEAPNSFDVIADGYTEADKARYAAAFDAVVPLAVRSANALRVQAHWPKR